MFQNRVPGADTGFFKGGGGGGVLVTVIYAHFCAIFFILLYEVLGSPKRGWRILTHKLYNPWIDRGVST